MPGSNHVTILMPTMGTNERWDLIFHRSLPSIMKQTHTDWSLIIIDDGSPNKVLYRHVKDRLEAYDCRIRVGSVGTKLIHYPDEPRFSWMAGPVRALNVGLANITDPAGWIFRMDDDDELRPHALEHLICGSFRKGGDLDVVFGKVLNGETGRHFTPYYYNATNIGSIQGMLYRAYMSFMRYNPDCWRKKYNAPNDVELQVRMVDAGARIGWQGSEVCVVNPRPGVTTVGSKAWLEEHAKG